MMEKTILGAAQIAHYVFTLLFSAIIAQVVSISEVTELGAIAKNLSVVTILSIVSYVLWRGYMAAQDKISGAYSKQTEMMQAQHERELAALLKSHDSEKQLLKDVIEKERSEKEELRKQLHAMLSSKESDLQKLLTLIAKEK